MQKDFYLNEISQAAYFEKDWFDHVVASGHARPSRFAFAPFDMTDLYSPYHERFADFIAAELKKTAHKPMRMLEIGSSTGRTYFELCRKVDSLRTATLIEPSENLSAIHSKIFNSPKDVEYFPALKGNVETVDVTMSTSPMRSACSAVDTQLLKIPFEQAPENLGQFDLVISSNVIDQCHEPIQLIDLLKRSIAANGLIAISCTYQWQPKYKGLPAKPIRHLDELFGEDWLLVNETNIPFQLRVNERHWMSFLSHVCLFKKRDIKL